MRFHSREVVDGVRQRLNRLQDVVAGDRHHHVQLEVAALERADRDGLVVADHLHHLADRLGNHRVDLAAWIELPGWRAGRSKLSETHPGAGRHPADVVGDLDQADGRRIQQDAARLQDRIERVLSLEMVRRLPDLDRTSESGSCRREPELGMRVDACANRRAAQWKVAQFFLRVLQAADRPLGLLAYPGASSPTAPAWRPEGACARS